MQDVLLVHGVIMIGYFLEHNLGSGELLRSHTILSKSELPLRGPMTWGHSSIVYSGQVLTKSIVLHNRKIVIIHIQRPLVNRSGLVETKSATITKALTMKGLL